MSLSLLLNDPAGAMARSNGDGAASAVAGPSSVAGSTASAPKKSKKKKAAPRRESQAAFAVDDDPDGLARRSSRQSGRPKRYVDEEFEDQQDIDEAYGQLDDHSGVYEPPSGNGDARMDLGAREEDLESDQEGGGLLRSTGFIWREPLQNYILSLHARKQQVEADYDADEQSRMFVTAARVVDMSARRIVEMKDRKAAMFVELDMAEENRIRAEAQAVVRAEQDEHKKLSKEKEKEERLRKQREAAKKKRDEERAKRERDDETRKLRVEKEKLAKAAEVERRAALTVEEREAEDKIVFDKAQLERDEALAKVRDEDELLGGPEGRGARKRRRREGDSALEEDAARALSGLGGYGRYNEDDYDELDELDELDPYEQPASKSRSKAKGSRRADYDYSYGSPQPTQNYYAQGAVDQLGNPINPYGYGYPPPLPPGAYVGPDGGYYDANGQPMALQAYPSGYPAGGYVPPPPGSYDGSHYSHGQDYEQDAYDEADDDDEGSATGGSTRTPKALAQKRWKAIEEHERKVWTQIARRDIPKVYRVVQQSISSRLFFAKRLSTIVAREARRGVQRTKGVKDVQTRAKRVMRETLTFIKTNEKKERESRKKAEKEALDKAKREEDIREAKRAARKLNFLITQTELYSHFVGNKIKTSEAEDSADTAGSAPAAAPQQSASLLAAIAAGDTPAGTQLKDLDFDVDDEANAAQHARRNAQAAVDAAKKAAAEFDAAASEGGVAQSKPAAGMSFDDSDELNFQNPTLMNGDVNVKQPKLLTCTLKEYQLKGLNWLANLYEQGINGILADEMGLGKTVQSISLMAYLAEVHNIWGPFLVIAPASTLHNWQQEISRFVPGLKALPYWGNTKDRAVLRKFWNRKSLRYDKDAPFHILVTSYQLVVQDEKYFQGVKWQYMVLDEAQAIKSSTSARWKTLLGFRCRNRLLLTGTPIQNSMHELWALLHFIMPSLFDSHDEFSEWFSKDIEGNAENKGAMNEHQLRRLHMILKPFMLRRIKKNVQNELGDKIEIDVYCDLTARQKRMYRTLREHISITDLVSRASSLNDDDSVKRLMNLIMQFRKVCNHPELFERADVTAPLAFASFSRTANLIRDPEVLEVPYATQSVIEYRVPKKLYRYGGVLNVPGPDSGKSTDTLHLTNLMNIWTPEYIQRSMSANESTFAFAHGLALSPAEVSKSVKSHGIIRAGMANERDENSRSRHLMNSYRDDESSSPLSFDILPKSSTLPFDNAWRSLGLSPLSEIQQKYRTTSRLARPDARFYMDKVVAPAINAVSSDRSFTYDQERERFDPLFSAALFGIPSASYDYQPDISAFQSTLPGFPVQGTLAASSPEQLPFPSMQVPQLRKLILDSGKLAKLDALLAELKTGGHRVLLYFQMTRMIDLMEEYLAFRQYKYLRLDGGSTISERRDMVMDWQTKPELFIFLLSTRAGGLGINLTAADTVIFYDSDWNPSNDLQAMDRAHRLGQTKQVTVYRLITKDTVDERIVQLARNKKIIQDAVVGSSSATPAEGGGAKTNEVVSLLLGEDELEEGLRMAALKRKRAEEKAVEDGRRGAKTREENKAKSVAAAAFAVEEAARKKAAGGTSWMADDDEDAFSFFTNPANGGTAADDDDGQPGGAGGETPKKPPRKRKPKGAPAVPKEGGGEPPKKRVRKKKEPVVVAPLL